MKARVIAFYLPQYHPIPENDEWWGKGFTEWTNVAKAKPLFKGHYQPHIPADLGFYDLRLPQVRELQAELARNAGIEGFCYWHYWFGNGRMLLDLPFREVLESGKPDFPFCLGWANGSWDNGTWTRTSKAYKKEYIAEQFYSHEDYKAHFFHVLNAFRDNRYIKVDGKPLFYIHEPLRIPDVTEFISLWQNLAKDNGLEGVFFVGRANNASFWHLDEKGNVVHDFHPNVNNSKKMYEDVLKVGFDAVNSWGIDRVEMIVGGMLKTIFSRVSAKIFKKTILRKYDMKDLVENYYVPEDSLENVFPTIIPNWDRSPREGKNAAIYYNSTPEVFERELEIAVNLVKGKSPEHKILFLRAWNEWGEGNHVEPDLKYGHGYLDVMRNILNEKP